MKPSLWDYLRAAFDARPLGMFVAPNWIGLAVFGLLGLVNPGFWLIGLGVEFGYLGLLATNRRFQRTVSASRLSTAQLEWQKKQDELVAQLTDVDQARYVALAARCRAILDQQLRASTPTPVLEAQSENLGRLIWTYLRLLNARRAMTRVLREAPSEGSSDALDGRIAELRSRLANPSLGEGLRTSLQGQLEILEQRLAQRTEGREKLAFLEAELARIQEQVELIRERAALAADSKELSTRIDEITSTLGGTTRWISDQQRLFGAMEDLLAEPPPMALPPRPSQRQ